MTQLLLRIVSLLEGILRELRKFNQTVPLLDGLADRQEALRAIEDRGNALKASARRMWRRTKNDRNAGGKKVDPRFQPPL